MDNNVTVFFFNGFHDKDVVLSGSGVEAAYPVSALRDFRLSRRIKFTSALDEKSITLDWSSVPAWKKHVTAIAFAEHNLSNVHTLRALGNPTDSWATPATEINDFVFPLDPDTEPTYYNETNLTRAVYKTLFYKLDTDLLEGTNNFTKFIFETDNEDVEPLEFGAILAGHGYQYEINYMKDGRFGWVDISQIQYSSGQIPFIKQKGVAVEFEIDFDYSGLSDTQYSRYWTLELDVWHPVFIALEPDYNFIIHAQDGYRSHRNTYYGFALIQRIENKYDGKFFYSLKFKEELGGAGKPPYILTPAITVVLISVTVTPSSVTLNPDDTQDFEVIGNFSDGSTGAVTGTWSAEGGTIDSNGLYTAGAILGVYNVMFTESTLGLTDNAVVTIEAVAPPSCILQDTNLLLNPSFEEGTTARGGITNWTGEYFKRSSFNSSYDPAGSPYAPQAGTYFAWTNLSGAYLYQNVNVSACATEIDAANSPEFFFSIWCRTDTFSPNKADKGEIRVRALDAGLNVLSELYYSGIIVTQPTYINLTQSFTVPVNTRYIQVYLVATRGSSHPGGHVGVMVCYDNLSLIIPS